MGHHLRTSRRVAVRGQVVDLSVIFDPPPKSKKGENTVFSDLPSKR